MWEAACEKLPFVGADRITDPEWRLGESGGGGGGRDERSWKMRCSEAPQPHGSNAELGVKGQSNGGLGGQRD